MHRVECDILVIGAGGAGLRAAIAACDAGARVVVVSKSLLGKAHTVMAEGGIAASLGNVDGKDDWQAHFADTIIEGAYLSDWRMAEILAKEAAERVYELERYGALFDRTQDGRIMQRAFGGHTYRRLCHVGDKTGLELLRTLEDQVLHRDIEVMDETYVTKIFARNGRIQGAIGLQMKTGRFVAFEAKAIIIATGGCGRVYKVTSNSWESTADGIGLAYNIGAELMDMEMVQFHPTGMVYPPGAKGLLVTEGVRGEGGILLNSKGERFMERYAPERKELAARDIVARAIYKEIEEGRGTAHGGVYLDISHLGEAFIKHKLPSMYSQFRQFADVDITKEAMEVAPTVHYQMGGIRTDPETAATNIDGLFAAGEAAGGLHGGNRLGGNSLADILVFGKRAGEAASKHALASKLPEVSEAEALQETRRVSSYLGKSAKGPNPNALIEELRESMENGVGIIRDRSGLSKTLKEISELKSRQAQVRVPGTLVFNHGLLSALALENMLVACEAITRSALERRESRGAHWRSDFPRKSRRWHVNMVCFKGAHSMKLRTVRVRPMPQRLKRLIKHEVYR
ncbi:MAG: FAD-binding protein [Candidatus Micrarchaeota archaeon]|nr:FAD-binding protein [Candidatus Micrarchaeota archaeon]MDE1824474.1 FAD-binding protein [Candidatus Micrarchaeota archaeon]MDE1849783.1 FAD-binding protein [Candidatus Micrarchaeota archaeon]